MPRTFGAGVVGQQRLGLVVHGAAVQHLARRCAARPALGGRRDPYDGAVRVSTRGDYACRALLSLALHADETGPTSVRDIAERTGLPQPYLEQILLALKGAGLVRSKRGVGGGYVLARPPDEIRLSRDRLAPSTARSRLGDFGEPHQDGACDHEGQCVLLAIWKAAGEQMRRHLEGFTLADGRRRGPRRRAVAGARPRRAAPSSTPSTVRARLEPRQATAQAQAGVDGGEVGGQRRRERQPLAGDRVVEGRARRRAGTAAATPSAVRGRRRRSASPTTGWPIAARWTRIWWVRPVSSRHSQRRQLGRAVDSASSTR